MRACINGVPHSDGGLSAGNVVSLVAAKLFVDLASLEVQDILVVDFVSNCVAVEGFNPCADVVANAR